MGRAVVGCPVVADASARPEAVDPDRLLARGDIGDPVGEQRADVVLAAPQRWRLRAGRGRWDVWRHRGEQLSDEAPGVQLSRPMVPPGRQTRTSSSALAWWRGANMTPTQ